MSDADQLLLDWARDKFPEWAKRRVDQHNQFVDRTNAHNERNPDYRIGIQQSEILHVYTLAHIRNCGPRIFAVDHEWECGCYSEYTRDDSWMVHCRVSCAHDLLTEMRLAVSIWEMPQLIQDLADADEGCAYDE